MTDVITLEQELARHQRREDHRREFPFCYIVSFDGAKYNNPRSCDQMRQEGEARTLEEAIVEATSIAFDDRHHHDIKWAITTDHARVMSMLAVAPACPEGEIVPDDAAKRGRDRRYWRHIYIWRVAL